MSVYRFICMKKPNIAMNLQSQRNITFELIILEWITLIFLLGIHFFGTKMRGTSLSLANCRGHSMEMDQILQEGTGGKSLWAMSLGNYSQIVPIVYCQAFIIFELVIYIIIFIDLYQHNEKMMNGNQLGLSKDTLKKRKRQNVITLFGQCLSFFIEIIAAVVVSVFHINDIAIIRTQQFFFALLTTTFFLSSPELKRFYFNDNRINPHF